MVVTVACILGALLQLDVVDRIADVPWLLIVVVMFGAPLGVGFGALAGYTRSDRVAVLIASVLGLMSVVLGLGAVTTGDLEWQGRVLSTYPWIVGGALLLGWWTRRPAPPTVPVMRVRGRFLPHIRLLTAVEVSALLSVACAIAIAFGTDIAPRYALEDMNRARPSLFQIAGVLATMAFPLGVGVGKVAAAVKRGRGLLVPLVAVVGTVYAWLITVSIVDQIVFAVWSPVAIVVTAIAIVRLASPKLES